MTMAVTIANDTATDSMAEDDKMMCERWAETHENTKRLKRWKKKTTTNHVSALAWSCCCCAAVGAFVCILHSLHLFLEKFVLHLHDSWESGSVNLLCNGIGWYALLVSMAFHSHICTQRCRECSPRECYTGTGVRTNRQTLSKYLKCKFTDYQCTHNCVDCGSAVNANKHHSSTQQHCAWPGAGTRT